MPEQVIVSQRPLHDAIAKVTNNGRDSWHFTAWTTPGTANNPTKIFDSISSDVYIPFSYQYLTELFFSFLSPSPPSLFKLSFTKPSLEIRTRSPACVALSRTQTVARGTSPSGTTTTSPLAYLPPAKGGRDTMSTSSCLARNTLSRAPLQGKRILPIACRC